MTEKLDIIKERCVQKTIDRMMAWDRADMDTYFDGAAENIMVKLFVQGKPFLNLEDWPSYRDYFVKMQDAVQAKAQQARF